MNRIAEIKRKTNETDISVNVNLDGTGANSLKTGLPFLEHMLDQFSKHGCIDLAINANGDLDIDAHHTVEDIGITLGEALNRATGDKQSIKRYGLSYVPLDESLSRVVIDLSGRPGLTYEVSFPRSEVGGFDVDLFREFFQAFTNHCKCTLHIDTIRGSNAHHIIETVFKAFGRATRMALEKDTRMTGLPSTKGKL